MADQETSPATPECPLATQRPVKWLTIRNFVPEGHRSRERADRGRVRRPRATGAGGVPPSRLRHHSRSGLGGASGCRKGRRGVALERVGDEGDLLRSEEHTSELQSRQYLVCRLLLEKNI